MHVSNHSIKITLFDFIAVVLCSWAREEWIRNGFSEPFDKEKKTFWDFQYKLSGTRLIGCFAEDWNEKAFSTCGFAGNL